MGPSFPAGGHYLCVNSVGYSLASYPAGNGTTATGDATYTTDIPDNAGIAIFNNNTGGGSFSLANRLDAVGSTSEANTPYKEGTGYPALTPFSIDYSWLPRRLRQGRRGEPCSARARSARRRTPTTTRWISIFVDTNGTSAGAGQRLGAPGPQNLSSPLQRNATIPATAARHVRRAVGRAEPRPRLHERSREQLDVRDARHPPHVHQQHRRQRHAAALPRHRSRHVPGAVRLRRPASENVDVGRGRRSRSSRRAAAARRHVTVQGTTLEAAAVTAERRRVQQLA